MKLLLDLTQEKIKSLGLRKLRDSITSDKRYTLLKEGSCGRLMLVDSVKLADAMSSSKDYEVFDKDFLKTPQGVFRIVSETDDSWLVDGDEDTLQTILKPEGWDSEETHDEEPPDVEEMKQKEVKPAYPMGELMRPDDYRLLNPPYDTMNKFVWRKAIDQTQTNQYGKLTPAKVLATYRRIKYNR
nr:MAG TPA: hypothetical protein [Caudoviricetes sp.]